MDSRKREEGLLIRIKGSDYYVMSSGREVRCFLRGRFRINDDRILPVVGDRVIFRLESGSGSDPDTGLILSVGKRKSVYARSSAGGRKRKILGANLDYVFLVHSVKKPELNTRLLDRMIVAAEFGGIEPVICINKIDLPGGSGAVRDIERRYRAIGYEVILCSAKNNVRIDRLRSLMKDRVSLMAGPSGSGKTTIMSSLEPHLDIRIGEVSSSTGKGRHTTSHLELHPLSCGGYLGDTPGIRGFGVELVERDDLHNYFIEFRQFRDYCRFKTCLHYREPDCAVKQAVEEGRIDSQRYESYVRMLEDMSGEKR